MAHLCSCQSCTIEAWPAKAAQAKQAYATLATTRKDVVMMSASCTLTSAAFTAAAAAAVASTAAAADVDAAAVVVTDTQIQHLPHRLFNCCHTFAKFTGQIVRCEVLACAMHGWEVMCSASIFNRPG